MTWLGNVLEVLQHLQHGQASLSVTLVSTADWLRAQLASGYYPLRDSATCYVDTHEQ